MDCFPLESAVEPAFVDVAVRRWERSTGMDAVLDGMDKTFAQTASERER